MTVALAEGLHGRLAVEHGGDDVAVVGVRLRTHHDPVAVADGRVDHRLAADLQHEQVALAHELAGKREDLLDLLVGGDGNAGGDASDERYERRVAEGRRHVGGVLGCRARQVDEDLHRARLAGVAAQVAAQLELIQLVGDAGERLQSDGVTDLAHAGRIAVPRDGGLDHLEDLQLLVAQALASAGLGLVGHVARSFDRGLRKASPSNVGGW